MTDTVHIIKKDDERYPALLRQIADPPKQLYCRGNLALLDSFCIAVVGTRKASDYGRQACRDIAGHLSASGITIVSGLALGIDTIAHQSTFPTTCATIGVLASGVDDASIYPQENVGIAQDIIHRGGLVISEYEPGFKAQLWSFPRRNRIVSGLSRGVLVVEADRKSGSLITAQCALDQNRDVFAVPGSIYWPRSVGANWLIQQGARPVVGGMDILQSYQLRQITLPPEDHAVSTQDPVQDAILAILKSNGPTHLDVIAIEVLRSLGEGGETPRVMAAIALLELHGRITHQGNGTYTCN